jgi:hypothetical protein
VHLNIGSRRSAPRRKQFFYPEFQLLPKSGVATLPVSEAQQVVLGFTLNFSLLLRSSALFSPWFLRECVMLLINKLQNPQSRLAHAHNQP